MRFDLSNWNSTSGKTLAGISMAHIVLITVCAMEVAGRHFNDILLLELLAFVAAWAGISYQQFKTKRETEIVTPPQTMAENAPATSTRVTDTPQPVGRPHPDTDPAIVGALSSYAKQQDPGA